MDPQETGLPARHHGYGGVAPCIHYSLDLLCRSKIRRSISTFQKHSIHTRGTWLLRCLALGIVTCCHVPDRATVTLLSFRLYSWCFHLQRFWGRERPASPRHKFGALPSSVSSKVKTAMSKASLSAELHTRANIGATMFKPNLLVRGDDGTRKYMLRYIFLWISHSL